MQQQGSRVPFFVLLSLGFVLIFVFQNCSQSKYETSPIISSIPNETLLQGSSQLPTDTVIDNSSHTNSTDCSASEYYDLATQSCKAKICIPRQELANECPSIAFGKSVRTCNDLGSEISTCYSACNIGYDVQAGTTQPNISCVKNQSTIEVNRLTSAASQNCFINQTGALRCWGRNTLGELGIGQASEWPSQATTVFGMDTNVAHVSHSGSHGCAIKEPNGDLYCWGTNTAGQLGLGTKVNELVPRKLSAISNVTAVSTGLNSTCAIANGAAYCWGANAYGVLGNGNNIEQSTPTLVTGLESDVTQISVGSSACAVKAGSTYCWGLNNYTEDSFQYSSIPYRLNDIPTPTKIVFSGRRVCFIINGGVHCRSKVNGVYSLSQPEGLQSGVTDLAGSDGHACAIQNNKVRCFGAFQSGQLGIPVNNLMTGEVVGPPLNIDNPIAVSVGAGHSCALTNSSPVCWGQNGNGQLGDGTPSMRSDLSTIATNGVVTKLDQNISGRSCVFMDTGKVKCTGNIFEKGLSVTRSNFTDADDITVVPQYFITNDKKLATKSPNTTPQFTLQAPLYRFNKEIQPFNLGSGNRYFLLKDFSGELMYWDANANSTVITPDIYNTNSLDAYKYTSIFSFNLTNYGSYASLGGLTTSGLMLWDEIVDRSTFYSQAQPGYVGGISGGSANLPSYSYLCGITLLSGSIPVDQLRCVANLNGTKQFYNLNVGIPYNKLFRGNVQQGPLYGITKDGKLKIIDDPAFKDPIDLDPGYTYSEFYPMSSDQYGGCGITTNQELRCFYGSNFAANGTRYLRTPAAMTTIETNVTYKDMVVSTYQNSLFILALTADGKLKGKGSNIGGLLGSDSPAEYWQPRPVKF